MPLINPEEIIPLCGKDEKYGDCLQQIDDIKVNKVPVQESAEAFKNPGNSHDQE